MSTLDELHRTLAGRVRPEDAAELVRRELGDALSAREYRTLERAARGAHARNPGAYSSMRADFDRPVGLLRQVGTAGELFPAVDAPTLAGCDDPRALRPYLDATSATIAKAAGASDFLADRLDRVGRRAAGLGTLSKRQYNKRFRLLGRMERKLATLEREIRKREYTLIAKSRLASRLSVDEFRADRDAACFVAYLTARANLRSVFTDGPQARPFDEVAAMLLARCERAPAANWWAVAHAYPEPAVLARLSDERKGELLATWYGLLTGIAGLLKEVWEKSRFDRATMVVRRGDDSTTWNATAGAWNKACESWVALLHALNLDDLLDAVCPGKVLRLMAADVAAWHRRSGGGLEPDTAVWAALPPPWEVLSGTASCTRAEVEAACGRAGVDAEQKGWTAPRRQGTPEAFRPTPELVHGVAVGHPGLALLLRKLGAYSGKGFRGATP